VPRYQHQPERRAHWICCAKAELSLGGSSSGAPPGKPRPTHMMKRPDTPRLSSAVVRTSHPSRAAHPAARYVAPVAVGDLEPQRDEFLFSRTPPDDPHGHAAAATYNGFVMP